jgi:flagellar biosynthetic protein FliQ
MTPDTVMAVAREATLTAFFVAAPILGVILLTGLIVSVVQAVTQVQEMTLTFIPKVVGVALVLGLLGHWMLGRLVGFTVTLLGNLPAYAR